MIHYLKRKGSHLKKCFKEGENIIYDKAEIAHTFNNCFTNIWPNLANKINSNPDKSHPFYMNSKTLINFEFTDVTL